MNKQLQVLTLIAAVGFSGAANAASVSGQGTWETTLQGRDLDGNPYGIADFEAYYDTVLNITWLFNANLGAGSSYDDISGTGSTTDGVMSWTNANAWAANLNVYGITGWRLPRVSPVDGTTADDANFSYIGTEDRGYNISAPGTLYAGSTASEMAHLFYNTLGNKGYCNPTLSTVSSCSNQAGYGLVNSGPFPNIQVNSTPYWSDTGYALNTSLAWYFLFPTGSQDVGIKSATGSYAWAVHAGDVGASAVPVPTAVWLFGSGLLGLIGVARRKKA